MEDIVLKYGIIYIFALIAVFILFRKMLYSIIDPAIWLVPTFASLLALSSQSFLFGYTICSVLAFWLGMYAVTKNKIRRNFEKTKIFDSPILKYYTIFIYILYGLSALYIFATAGIPLFSNNPSEAKISVYEGAGILRRISFLGQIIPINLIILLIVSKKKRLFAFLLIGFCLLKIMQGSKSSITGLIFPLYYFMTQKNLATRTINMKHYKKQIAILCIIAVGILFVIVTKEAEHEGGDVLFSLGFRLMEFGDAMIIYPQPTVQKAFESYGPLNFLPDELNGILGMLRIAPYKLPLGAVMINEFNGFVSDTVTGPNAVMPVKGHIYFGIIGGVIYSYIIGVIFAKIRKYFFEMKIKDIYFYSFIAYIFFNLMGLVRESGAFISGLFDYVLYTFPILLLSQILDRQAKQKQSICTKYQS